MGVSLKLEDNSVQVQRALGTAKEQILFELGQYFTEKWDGQIVQKHVIDTGRYRNSIDHAEDENATYVGTPIGKEGSTTDPPSRFILNWGRRKWPHAQRSDRLSPRTPTGRGIWPKIF